MILSLDALKHRSFSVSDVNVIFQNPQYRELHSRGRICNGFIYIKHGECRYEFSDGSFSMCDGSLAYLPTGSHHNLIITSENIQFYRVDFTLKVDGEPVLFSNGPLKLCDEAPVECVEAIMALEGDYGIGDNNIIKTEKICTALASLLTSDLSDAKLRLMPAVRYLQENAAGKVDCGYLAELCFMGISRFYELFKAEFGVPPLEYRDKLLIKRAKALLKSGDISVSEVAFATGFESVAYFSRFFKKHTGQAPSEYLSRHT